ncbi:hypothetical protein K0504_08640 [Neiella marina]|uniref:Uncharacterized protein n=1 Tax=Neiella holothuriorum TaxID=2870530 RepID=A0ABS7EFV2_9GAMM|nr:DUF6776 family protein [Neiella holothuriorum]MBW8191099.1 hypothetical protein [Neiella holothuriorum]
MWIFKQLHLLINRIFAFKPLHSKRFAVVVIAVALVLIGFVVGRFYYGHHQAWRVDAEQRADLAELRLQESLKATASKDISLRMTNAELTWLQQENKKLQDEKLALVDELNLYRKVFRDGGSNDAMTIDSVELLKTNAHQVYRFRIILIQLGRFDNMVRGELALSLMGIRSGQPVQLDTWALLSAADKASLQFNFRYLQTIEGILQVPEGVMPEQLELQAKLKGMPKNKAVINASYEWRDIVQPAL